MPRFTVEPNTQKAWRFSVIDNLYGGIVCDFGTAKAAKKFAKERNQLFAEPKPAPAPSREDIYRAALEEIRDTLERRHAEGPNTYFDVKFAHNLIDAIIAEALATE